jgi:hypothetical protein
MPGGELPGRPGTPTQSPFDGATVRDLVFVLLTLAIFVLLGLAAKGAERL